MDQFSVAPFCEAWSDADDVTEVCLALLIDRYCSHSYAVAKALTIIHP